MIDRLLSAAVRPVARITARVIRPFVVEYLRYLAEDAEDAEPVAVDPRGTVFGQFEAAANRDHTTDEIFMFGFGKHRRPGSP